MKYKNLIKIMYLILIVLLSSLVSAMTIQELVDSYNYDYYDNTLNITSFLDYMADTNSNSINDTLFINISTDAATSGQYVFYADVKDDNGIFSTRVNKTINVGDKNASFNFSTELFSQNQFNYSIRIYNSNNILVYRKYRTETNNYSAYEHGINITSITDENLNNDFIQVNLTMDVTQNETVNITVFLKYDNSTIYSTKESVLSTGIKNVSIEFDNETIKSTHYNGDYLLDTVTIGKKIVNTNYTTSIYNFEDFAKTSYIKSFSSRNYDTNNNNLSEYLEINFTINVKNADTYIIEAEIYDLFDNYIASVNKSQSLGTGIQKIQALVNGSEIYQRKTDGPYMLSFAKLSIGNTLKDIIFGLYMTNMTYFEEYERPPLPDLTINMTLSHDDVNNKTNITLNISNIGNAVASHIFIDVFDNETYNYSDYIGYLDINESKEINISISNIQDNDFIAIVDLPNFVDETNESNNIDTNMDYMPIVILESPPNGTIDNDGNIVFNCSATDDKNLQNVSLYTNISGTWELNQTNIVTGTANSTIFTVNNIADKTNFIWNCLVYDNSGLSDWANANWSIKVNTNPPPTVTLESPSDNNVSTTGNITFNCSATDDKNLQNITLYTNISGVFSASQTNTVTSTANSTIFTINNIQDNVNFIWNCLAYDNASESDWGDANQSVKINKSASIIKVNVTDWKGNIVNETNKAATEWNVTFNVLVDSFVDFIDHFNNSLTAENLTFTQEGQISRHLELLNNAKAISGIIDLSGHEEWAINNFTDVFNRPNNDTVGNGWTDTSSSPADSDIENNQLHQFFTTGNGYATIYRNLTFIPENFTINYNASFIGGEYTYYVNRFEFYNSSGDLIGTAEYRVTNGTARDCSASSANFCTDVHGNNITGLWNRNVSADMTSIGKDLSSFIKLTYIIQSVSHLGGQRPDIWSDNAKLLSGFGNSYSTNPWLEVGNLDGIREWEYLGQFDKSNNQTNDLSSSINSYLGSCSPVNGKCPVPFIFYSFSGGKLEYSDLSVYYYSDVDSVRIVIWNTTKQDGNKFLERTMAFSDGIWRVDVKVENSFPEIINYTVYVNDTSNNVVSYDGSFGVSYITNESQGRIAIEQGINNSVVGNITIYTDYYIKHLNENKDEAGLFDKVIEELNQTWAFNYITQGESYTNMTSMPDPVSGPIVNIWENDSLTTEETTYQVETLVNQTKI